MSACTSNNLVPIRVDAFLDGKTRVVDTLLIDPYVMPIPHESLHKNCEYLAYNTLADTEVLGVSRNAHQFTGRVDVYSKELFKLITSQIKSQIQAARKLRDQGDQAHPESSELEKDAASTSAEVEDSTKSGLVPIRLRLSVHGIRIHDDFDWDPSLGVNPIDFAQVLGEDLNLSVEAVQAIAVSIAEQVHGSKIENVEVEKDEGGPAQRTSMTAAWRLEQRVHITNVAWLVEHHKKNR